MDKIYRLIWYMTVEQRKIELTNSITSIDNESLLIRIEELVSASKSEVPDSIIRLLDLSSKSNSKSNHKSVREFLK